MSPSMRFLMTTGLGRNRARNCCVTCGDTKHSCLICGFFFPSIFIYHFIARFVMKDSVRAHERTRRSNFLYITLFATRGPSEGNKSCVHLKSGCTEYHYKYCLIFVLFTSKLQLLLQLTDLCYQDIVLHLLSRLHNANNGSFDLVLPVVVHFLPCLLPLRVRLPLFSSH